MTELIRLSKLMSEKGICSRREAEKYIDQKQVLVDGLIIDKQGTKVSKKSKIELLDRAKNEKNEKVTILLNKPVGYVSTQPEKDYPAAIELIEERNKIKSKDRRVLKKIHITKLAVAGRLDIDSKGLLVLTQDGTIAKKIIGEDAHIEKEYLVRFVGDISDEKIKRISHGLVLDGKALKKAEVTLLHPNLLQIILHEGKKRQIRRMLEMVDLKVISLKRVRIGKVTLGDLPIGRWRFLKEDEKF
ncbi:MAG: rRNA pseudouridine synthase [Parachlamydiales bacterium]|nr:rRNA pseudouridine synthase [Parachlamydiales bacterium]